MQAIGMRRGNTAFENSCTHVEGQTSPSGIKKLLLLTIVVMSCGCSGNASSTSQQADGGQNIVGSNTVTDVASSSDATSSSSEMPITSAPQKAHDQSFVASGENPDAAAGSQGRSPSSANQASEPTQDSTGCTQQCPTPC